MEIMSGEKVLIRKAQVQDWDAAIALAWKTFLKFEAKDYGAEGTKSFQDFLMDEMLRRMFILGKYVMFVAELEGKIVGMISLRNSHHISLLFIDEEYQKKGVGKNLLLCAENYLKDERNEKMITVDSAPYAVEFYHRLCFVDTSLEQCREGIRFTSMEKKI